jgi:hypothetical protein
MTEVSLTDFQGVSAKFALGSPLTMISASVWPGEVSLGAVGRGEVCRCEH